MFQEYGFHALPSTDSVDALELVENLCFDVAVVSDEMPSALPELLFKANRENWLEVLTFGTPEDNFWDLGEFMLAVNEAAQERNWKCYLIEEAWHDGWYGEAGYDPWSRPNVTEAQWQASMDALEEALAASRRSSGASSSTRSAVRTGGSAFGVLEEETTKSV